MPVNSELTSEDVLPTKLSELLELALKDFAKCRRSKKYSIDMYYWHTPTPEGCHVCLAGSVMAKTLNAPNIESVWPEEYPDATANKLRAISKIALGHCPMCYVMEYVGEREAWQLTRRWDDLQNRFFVAWEKDSMKWLKYIRKVIKLLQEVGV